MRRFVLLLLVLALPACGGGDDGGQPRVFAAASLTEAFTEMATAFKTDNPDANVTFNFAGSGDLVTQITQGAPADVFVSADDTNMKKLTDAGENAGEPVAIARGLVLTTHGFVLSSHTMVDNSVSEEALDAELVAVLTRALKP